jgi:hypothetical protein
MTHDPLCPYTPEESGFGGINSGISNIQPYIPGNPCQCDLIAKVREDTNASKLTMWNHTQEQAAFVIETAIKSVWIDGYGEGREDMLAKAIAAIEQRIPLIADNASWESSIAAAWLRAAVTDLQKLETTI